MADQDQCPQRAVVVTISLGADTFRDAADKLRDLANDLDVEGQPRSTVWGGNSTGGSITVTHDASRTPEWYAAALSDYLDALDV